MQQNIIEQRLARITPGEVLSLFHCYEIQVFVSSQECKDEKDPKGCLGNLFGEGRKCWLITVCRLGRLEETKTLLHELFHLLLIHEDFDQPDKDQAYDDSIIERSVESFVQKFPAFGENLWSLFENTGKRKKSA
jgi:hypothetical protein